MRMYASPTPPHTALPNPVEVHDFLLGPGSIFLSVINFKIIMNTFYFAGGQWMHTLSVRADDINCLLGFDWFLSRRQITRINEGNKYIPLKIAEPNTPL